MIEFVTNYWLAIAPVLLTGFYLLGVLKRLRDEKSARQPAPATIALSAPKSITPSPIMPRESSASAAIGRLKSQTGYAASRPSRPARAIWWPTSGSHQTW